MRKLVGRLILPLFLLGLGGFWLIVEAKAQIDFFTFFIPYPADILDDQFDVGHAAINLINSDIETTISISIHRDDTIIYYDHWEDGLEETLTIPVQPSTEIWGDNDPTNGIPPNFTTDILTAGDIIILREIIPLPRDPAQFFPDGGDKLSAIGGAIAVTVAVWPLNTPQSPGILYAGAWELYPTNKWGLDYRIPVGEDLAVMRPGFRVVGINVQAVENNTTVQLDLDADGIFETTMTLDQGKQFTQVSGVNRGAHVLADKPVQVHILSANPTSSFEARAYTMIPFDQWTNELLAPRSSDGDFWLYNPHSTPLTVTVETATTTTALNIPPNSTASFPPGGLSQPTATYFSASDGRPFFGVAALDAMDAQDWGYTLLPVDALSTQTLVGLGIGNNNPGPDGDESRIYVTALATTTIFVDYDNDGTADATFPVTPLQEVDIIDPDHDLTGAFLYTEDGVPFVIVWGQDESSPPNLPSIDVGTSIVPFPTLLIQKTVNSLVKDIDCTGTTTPGDIIQYKLEYFNNSANALENIIIQDNLPLEVAYVPNSTWLNGNLIGDDNTGTTPFLFDEGGYNIGSVPASEKGFMTFDAKINTPIDLISNQAIIQSTDPSVKSEFALVFTPVMTNVASFYEIDTTLIDPMNGTAESGDNVTFALTVTNTTGLTITAFSLRDTFEESHLIFQQAVPPPDTIGPGLVEWSDLTNALTDVPAGQAISTTISFIVGQIPLTLTETVNQAIGVGGELSDGTTLPPCSDEATVPFDAGDPTTTPTITPDPSGTPTVTSTPNQTVTPNVSPTPTPTQPKDDDATPPTTNLPPSPPTTPQSTPQITPEGTPVASANPSPLPVVLLPETGQFSPQTTPVWPWIVVSAALVGLLGWIRFYLTKWK